MRNISVEQANPGSGEASPKTAVISYLGHRTRGDCVGHRYALSLFPKQFVAGGHGREDLDSFDGTLKLAEAILNPAHGDRNLVIDDVS